MLGYIIIFRDGYDKKNDYIEGLLSSTVYLSLEDAWEDLGDFFDRCYLNPKLNQHDIRIHIDKYGFWIDHYDMKNAVRTENYIIRPVNIKTKEPDKLV